jgi:hypothetical protein
MVDRHEYVVEIFAGMAEFMLGAEDDPASVEDVDAVITLDDSTRWSATFLTLDAIARILDRWKASGERLGGSYFSCPDLLIVRSGGIPAMTDVLDELSRQDLIRTTLGPLNSLSTF